MEAELQDLISRARTSLVMLVAVLPPNPKGEQLIDEALNRNFPLWVTSKDRRLLESSIGEIKANVVVAKDGSGNFNGVAEAVASAPNKGPHKHQAVGLRVGAALMPSKTHSILTPTGAGTSKRVSWSGYHIIKTTVEANEFTVKQLIHGDVWLKNTGVNFIEGL